MKLQVSAFPLPAGRVIGLALNRHLAIFRRDRLSAVDAESHATAGFAKGAPSERDETVPLGCARSSLTIPGRQTGPMKPYRLAPRRVEFNSTGARTVWLDFVLDLGARDRLVAAVADTTVAPPGPILSPADLAGAAGGPPRSSR
jgi:hypothetical protein